MAISRYKLVFILIFLQLLLFQGRLAELSAHPIRSVQIAYGRMYHGALAAGYKLRSIRGDGLSVQLDFRLSKRFTFLLEGGYFDTAVDQEEAVEQWNWPFWERFYGNYVRALVSRDSNYAVDLDPEQHLYMIPVQFGLRYDIPAGSFRPFISAAAGVVFYERNLRLNEEWTKYFPEIDHRFRYEYDNHADVRKGEVFSAMLGAGTEYVLNESFALTAGLYYRYYQVRESDRLFPLESSIGISLGLVLYY